MATSAERKTGKRKTAKSKLARLKANRARVRAFRAKQRAKGLRLVQFWVPDVRSPEFIAEARRQALLVANSRQEKDDLDFIERISDWSED
ncbi:MAG: antitoxin MazE family protein [Tagaea sp.]